MDFFAFLSLLASLGILLLIAAIAAVVFLLYWLASKLIKPQNKGWLFVAIVGLVLCFVPDPLDILSGGVPVVEIIATLMGAYKVFTNRRR